MQHCDRGSQSVAIKYTERVAEVGIVPSDDSVGRSYYCEYVAAARRA